MVGQVAWARRGEGRRGSGRCKESNVYVVDLRYDEGARSSLAGGRCKGKDKGKEGCGKKEGSLKVLLKYFVK
jgi:hypothetical protein